MIRRFFYVQAPTGKVLHLQYGKSHSEGPVACGRQSKKGWIWWRHIGQIATPICRQCEWAA